MNLGGAGSRSARWVALLLVAAPLIATFGPVLLADRSLAVRDAAHFYQPLFAWTSDQWLASGPPLWNPFENAGAPLLADSSSSLFYPGQILLVLPFDFAWRYKLYVVGHVALAAMGSYVLARRWRYSLQAAAMAAVVYSCGGTVLFQVSNVVFLVGAAWLPFAVLAIDWMLVDRSWLGAGALSAVLSLMVLGGDPQMAYHTVLIAAAYALIRTFRARATPSSGHWPQSIGIDLSLIGAATAGALLLASIQVLPSLEAAASSDRAYYHRPRNLYEARTFLFQGNRGQDDRWNPVIRGLFGRPEPGTHHEHIYEFSVPPWRLIELLWPNVGGRMFPTHRRWLSFVPAEGRIWTPTIYLGLLPLLLALWQFRLRGDPRTGWLSWLLLLFTVGSFGWYGLGWCAREFFATVLGGDAGQVPIGAPVGGLYWLMVTVLPGYAGFRYPAKLLVVASLAASQLAARGIDRAFEGDIPRLSTTFKWLAVTSAIMLGGSWIAFIGLHNLNPHSPLGQSVARFLAGHKDPSLGPFDLLGCRNDVCGAFLQAIVVSLAGNWLLRAGRTNSTWRWGVVALAAIDLGAANGWLVATAPAEIWRTRPAMAAAIHADRRASPITLGDARRVFRADLMHWRPRTFLESGTADRIAQIAVWERDTLFPKYGLRHGISLIESYGSLNSIDHESLIAVAKEFGPAMRGKEIGAIPHPDVLSMLGTEYLVLPKGWQPEDGILPPFSVLVEVPADTQMPEDAALWRLSDPFPRAWIVHDVEQFPSLKGRQLAAVEERTRDVIFPRTDGLGRIVRNFRVSAVVESELKLALPKRKVHPGGESCHISHYGREHVEIDANLTEAGLVVLNDTYSPGWTATVTTGGQLRSAVILRTNRVCRGILLPAGRHRIAYDYRPPTFRFGAWVSGTAWLALAVAAFAWLTIRRPLPDNEKVVR